MSLGDASRLVVVGLIFTGAGMVLSALATAAWPATTDVRRVLPVRVPFQHVHRAGGRDRIGGEAAVAAISLMIGDSCPS
jgi:hypothetical protein